MGSSCGSPRPICPVLATILALLAMPWGRRPNIQSSASWVSAGLPPVTRCCRRELQVSTVNHYRSFCHSKSDSKTKQSDSQISIVTPARDRAFCTQDFLGDRSCPNCNIAPMGAGKESLGSKKQLDQKSPSFSSKPRRFWLNK